jgi:hypothetical protein
MSPTRARTSSIANDDVAYCSGTFSFWEQPRCHSFVSESYSEIFDCYSLSIS